MLSSLKLNVNVTFLLYSRQLSWLRCCVSGGGVVLRTVLDCVYILCKTRYFAAGWLLTGCMSGPDLLMKLLAESPLYYHTLCGQAAPVTRASSEQGEAQSQICFAAHR